MCHLIPAESPAFEVLPSLKRLKQRVMAAGHGQYDAVFMSGRYIHWLNMVALCVKLLAEMSFYLKSIFFASLRV